MNSRFPFSVWATLVAVTLGLLASPAPAVAASPRPAPAMSVLVERSGGFAGGTDAFVASRSTGGRQAARLLRLAADRSFRTLHAEYLPANPCCDRYRYRVVVRYADGAVQTVTTVEDAPGTPWVLDEVVRLTMLVGTAA